MEFTQNLYPIKSKKEIAVGIYDMLIDCPELAAVAKCGQFLHILPDGCSLRRPISICGIDTAAGTLRMVFEVRGTGTDTLASAAVGDKLDILGPLGNGFRLLPDVKHVILIGGGIGTPPMLSLASHYGSAATAITGFRNAAAVILQQDFADAGTQTILCTDDGSAGRNGLVTIPLKELLEKGECDTIYACGPTPMLRAVSEIAAACDVPCQVSLEERMGCGVGACLVCACRVKTADGIKMKHVCKDGPVFDAGEVFGID